MLSLGRDGRRADCGSGPGRGDGDGGRGCKRKTCIRSEMAQGEGSAQSTADRKFITRRTDGDLRGTSTHRRSGCRSSQQTRRTRSILFLLDFLEPGVACWHRKRLTSEGGRSPCWLSLPSVSTPDRRPAFGSGQPLSACWAQEPLFSLLPWPPGSHSQVPACP